MAKTDFDKLGNRVTAAESSITQNANSINQKVAKDEVISEINQSAESVKISAEKVEINGDLFKVNAAFQRPFVYDDMTFDSFWGRNVILTESKSYTLPKDKRFNGVTMRIYVKAPDGIILWSGFSHNFAGAGNGWGFLNSSKEKIELPLYSYIVLTGVGETTSGNLEGWVLETVWIPGQLWMPKPVS